MLLRLVAGKRDEDPKMVSLGEARQPGLDPAISAASHGVLAQLAEGALPLEIIPGW